ncbi:late transcription unit A protein [Chlamydia psittaci CP3]|nr:late transcription unit A protein [Chlamydia psittaci CP3]
METLCFYSCAFSRFLDIHGVLSTRKGEQVMKSRSGVWVGARGAIFYRIAS